MACRAENANVANFDALDFKYGRSDVKELEQRSLVDFFEHGDESAILERAAPDLKRVAFDHLLLAEGERAKLTQKLGFSRRITRYASAIGLVLNFKLPKKTKSNSDRFVASMATASGGASEGKLARLASIGIKCENAEVL